MLPPKVILSPIDFSDHSAEALEVAANFAASFGAQLYLAHVVPAIPKLPSASAIFHEAEYEDQLHQDAESRLAQLAAKISARGIAVKSVVGTANDVSMELLRIAEQNNVDLIVIATHGMTGWHKLAFGSVTDKVVRLSACPVLVIKSQHESEAGDSSAPHHHSVPVSR